MVLYGLRNRVTERFHRKGKVPVLFEDKLKARCERKKLNGHLASGREALITGWRVRKINPHLTKEY